MCRDVQKWGRIVGIHQGAPPGFKDVFVGMALGWLWGAKGVLQELSTAVVDRIIPGMGREEI